MGNTNINIEHIQYTKENANSIQYIYIYTHL